MGAFSCLFADKAHMSGCRSCCTHHTSGSCSTSYLYCLPLGHSRLARWSYSCIVGSGGPSRRVARQNCGERQQQRLVANSDRSQRCSSLSGICQRRGPSGAQRAPAASLGTARHTHDAPPGHSKGETDIQVQGIPGLAHTQDLPSGCLTRAILDLSNSRKFDHRSPDRHSGCHAHTSIRQR